MNKKAQTIIRAENDLMLNLFDQIDAKIARLKKHENKSVFEAYSDEEIKNMIENFTDKDLQKQADFYYKKAFQMTKENIK